MILKKGMAWLQNQSSRKFEVKNSGCHGGFLHLDTYQLHTKLYVNKKIKCSGCFWRIFILLKYFFHHATKFSIIIGNELQRIWTSWIIGSEAYNLDSLNHLFICSFIHSLHKYLLSTHHFFRPSIIQFCSKQWEDFIWNIFCRRQGHN